MRPIEQASEALMFNRKLWADLSRRRVRDANPQSVEVRQNIANIGIFVLSQARRSR